MKLYDKIYNCYLVIGRYVDNDRLYLGLRTRKENFADITINLSDYCLMENTIFVNGDISKGIKKQLEHYGILSKFLFSVQYNYGTYDCYSINLEKLKHYDPKGFKEAELQLDNDETLDCDIKI